VEKVPLPYQSIKKVEQQEKFLQATGIVVNVMVNAKSGSDNWKQPRTHHGKTVIAHDISFTKQNNKCLKKMP
jgi:hypothetical protein